VAARGCYHPPPSRQGIQPSPRNLLDSGVVHWFDHRRLILGNWRRSYGETIGIQLDSLHCLGVWISRRSRDKFCRRSFNDCWRRPGNGRKSSCRRRYLPRVRSGNPSIFVDDVFRSIDSTNSRLSFWWCIGQVVASVIAWGLIGNYSCESSSDCTRENNMGWRYTLFTMGGITFLMVSRTFVLR
jgi:hypothetical protein